MRAITFGQGEMEYTIEHCVRAARVANWIWLETGEVRFVMWREDWLDAARALKADPTTVPVVFAFMQT